MARQPCKQPGCHELVRSGWCDKHRPVGRTDRAMSWRWLYGSPKWKRMRAYVLRSEPFCRECEKRQITTIATEVDHITPHKGDESLMFDRDNLQSLCKPCHSRKTAAENGGVGKSR